MSYDNHHEWLSLTEISGPFLAVPVLKEAFPQGLEELDGIKRKRLRQAYDEWREAQDLDDPQFPELHAAWIDEVLSRGLELDEDGKGDVLKRADWCASNLKTSLPEHSATLIPDFAVVDEQQANKPMLLIQAYAPEVDLDATQKQDGWAATPADRMVQLCRSLGCRLGLVTNGERWMFVDAPVGAITTFASWYARIWSQEPITLQAFVHLLGIRRFFVDESEQLPALFDRSLKFQDEVTDALGEQVRRAVEVLIQTLDKADQDRNRELLHDVREPELYEAALTVMMRLVFLLSAEERGLLLMGDERYEANYALSTLRMQLRKESEEILERRWDAWSRLLAIFRAVFGGIEHENLRLPALGGSLFDPDRFPFLEGRAKGSNWRSDAAKPLPIDNRTVLLLLEAIQQFQGRTLSYRALDVEQIGYVYEGLLERTVKRTDEVTLELDATKSAKTPWVKLAELDSARLDGASRLAELLQERSGSSASRVRNDLAKPADDTLADRLLTASQGDTKLRDRVKPYAHLLRTDPWGYPLVYPAGAFIVTTGSDRRETGTHYTPKSLTEAIVTETLTPVAYVGPAEGTPRDQWVLKSPAELLDLKICDPAMGSGAFLVQACRWLSDRLVESWALAEASGKTVSVDGEVLEAGTAKEPLPRDSEARTVIARRLIAERCLYGVDLNPLAVELAKLSIWLVTLAKGRPFGFLDHNLRSGDSLLGITALEQLHYLELKVERGSEKKLFAQKIDDAVKEAIELRMELRKRPILDIRDVDEMSYLDQQARDKLEVLELIADALVGESLKTGGKKADVTMLSLEAGQVLRSEKGSLEALKRRAKSSLDTDLPNNKRSRKALHWCLEFPEVFVGNSPGFDAVIGNPPFSFGKNVSLSSGEKYNSYLCFINPKANKNADLVSHFFNKSLRLISENSLYGLIATSSIAEGATREAGLVESVETGCIINATSKSPWPGSANVFYCKVIVYKGKWSASCLLDARVVDGITSYLTGKRSEIWEPKKLSKNKDKGLVGVIPNGDGFFLDQSMGVDILESGDNYSSVVYRYVTGKDLNSDKENARYIINFWDWPLEKAEKFPLALDVVRNLVLPHRYSIKDKKKKLYENWWLYEANGKKLFCLLGEGKFLKGTNIISTSKNLILATARISSTNAIEIVPGNVVYAAEVVVFPNATYADFAVLQSTLHWIFAWQYGGKMKADLRYSPTMCTEPFPFITSDVLCAAGEKYFLERKRLLNSLGVGFTNFYRMVNDPSKKSDLIETYRKLRIDLDRIVLDGYGWNDVDLSYGFHKVAYLPEGKNTRFTVSEEAREELLSRLTTLNKERYAAENKNPEPRASSKYSPQKATKESVMQGGLFDDGVDE